MSRSEVPPRAARRALARRALVATTGSVAVLGALAPGVPAQAAPNPGQSINNDYGQSDAEVAAEITSQVNAHSGVIAARAKVASVYRVLVHRIALQKAARTTYYAALRTHNATRIRTAKARYAAAIRSTTSAKKSYAAAKASCNAEVAKVRAAYTKAHYRPVDGTYVGAVAQYFIPDNGLEPITVTISVYGGHVSDVSAGGYVTTGDSGYINADAVPKLTARAMAANDTATVATVSGATLTSQAFAHSLASALTKAGYLP